MLSIMNTLDHAISADIDFNKNTKVYLVFPATQVSHKAF